VAVEMLKYVMNCLNITIKEKFNNNMKCNGYNVINILLNKIILIIYIK